MGVAGKQLAVSAVGKGMNNFAVVARDNRCAAVAVEVVVEIAAVFVHLREQTAAVDVIGRLVVGLAEIKH